MCPMYPRKYDTWTDAVEDRGRQKGLAEGKAEGQAEGERKALKIVLSKRFGALPAVVATRIDAASFEDLDRWLGRSLEADTLARLFGDDGGTPPA